MRSPTLPPSVPSQWRRRCSAASRRRASGARGNGVLALHPGRLVFVLGVPRRTIEIPLAQIHDVEVSKALRTPGRYARNGRPWLMVRWKAPDGEGVIGVLLPDPQRWAQAIRPNE